MLYLKFFVNQGLTSRLIFSPALINKAGLYEDAFFIYTEAGKFDKRKIKGYVEPIFMDEINEDTEAQGFEKQSR